VERASGKTMMSGFHGVFSVGGIFSAAGVAALLGVGVTSVIALLAVLILIAIALAVHNAALLTEAAMKLLGRDLRSVNAGHAYTNRPVWIDSRGGSSVS
jgi:hypothetical protein